jgi:microcystin-dependent protein
MADPFLGEIRMAGFNFAPRGWAFCNGAIVSIAQNSALFALLGVTYGGNGTTTFGLPNLAGRLPLNQGQGPGLSPRTIGEMGGVEHVTLTPQQMPNHTHTLVAASGGTRTSSAAGNLLASGEADIYARGGAQPVALSNEQISYAGAGQPHSNLQPFLAVNFFIAFEGIFPSRN